MLNKAKKILVIDDEKNIREDLKLTLELNGFSVSLAEDGLVGIEKIKSENPDMIICDIMMPKVDGYGVINFCRKNEAYTHIPFLFLSAKGDYTDLREGMNLGADDYIPKPFDFKQLLDAINTRLDKSDKKIEKIQKGMEDILSNLNRSIPHEFRTPLNGILNYAEYLFKHRNELDSESIDEMLSSIIKDSRRLQDLIENYIYFANLETMIAKNEQVSFRDKTTINPNGIIRNYCKLQSDKIKKRIKIVVKNDIDKINIDELHFTKILKEILNNAIKFSYPDTKIIIESISNDKGYSFVIENAGRGFPADLLSLIGAFSQFERDKFEQQGIGLGLAIVDKLIRIYDGKIIIESEKEKFAKVGYFIPKKTWSLNLNKG